MANTVRPWTRPEDVELARKVIVTSIVLMKNVGLLPIDTWNCGDALGDILNDLITI
jgi:hypothetical protein